MWLRLHRVSHQQADRLELAEQIGATVVDRSAGEVVERITELTGGGADRGVDAVGYQAHEIGGVEQLAFAFGTFFFKGQSMGTGQCNTKQYNAALRDLIIAGRANPGFLVSHELSLEKAAEGYDHFDKREDGWTKVLLHPAA